MGKEKISKSEAREINFSRLQVEGCRSKVNVAFLFCAYGGF